MNTQSQKIENVELVMFDWDGTLCDTRHFIHKMNMLMCRHYGVPVLSFEEWLSTSHPSPEDFLRAHGVEAEIDSIHKLFDELLLEHAAEDFVSPLYRGTLGLLQILKENNIPVTLISRHLHDHLLKDIRLHNLDQFFAHVQGEVPGVRTSKPEIMSRHCDLYGVDPQNAVYVGDNIHDVFLAKKAGVQSVAITHGYESEENLQVAEPDFLFRSLSELKEAFFRS